ncbi:MAG: hypothetical protein RI928_102 [Pseudomonadota bacterium]|jgi:hypothetical protein
MHIGLDTNLAMACKLLTERAGCTLLTRDALYEILNKIETPPRGESR